MIRDRWEFSTIVPSGSAADVLVTTIGPTQVGTAVRFLADIANFQNTVTAGLKIVDSKGRTVWSTTGLSKGTVTPISLDVDIYTGDQIRLTTSGDIGSGPNKCNIVLYIRV